MQIERETPRMIICTLQEAALNPDDRCFRVAGREKELDSRIITDDWEPECGGDGRASREFRLWGELERVTAKSFERPPYRFEAPSRPKRCHSPWGQ